MKKITRSFLDRVLHCTRLYLSLDLRPAGFIEEMRDLEDFIRKAGHEAGDAEIKTDIVYDGRSDRSVLEKVLVAKTVQLLKTLLSSSEQLLDRAALENFISRLEKKC